MAARELADELLAGEWKSRGEIERAQLERLNELIDFASRCSRFHARRFRKAGLRPGAFERLSDLRRLPLMTRRDLQDSLRHIRARALPDGVRAGDLLNLVVESEQGGTLQGLICRVSEKEKLEVHLDTDEGNALDLVHAQKAYLTR